MSWAEGWVRLTAGDLRSHEASGLFKPVDALSKLHDLLAQPKLKLSYRLLHLGPQGIDLRSQHPAVKPSCEHDDDQRAEQRQHCWHPKLRLGHHICLHCTPA